jgi:hypothetical protein
MRREGRRPLGLPTDPQFTNSTPPNSCPRLVRVAEHEDVGLFLPREPFVESCRLVLEEVLVDFARGPCTRCTGLSPTWTCRSNGRSRMKSFEAWSVAQASIRLSVGRARGRAG